MPVRHRHRVGDYLMRDDESGLVHYRSEMVQLWNGNWVHKSQYETRQPQEFVRARSDPRALKHIRVRQDATAARVFIPDTVGETTVPYQGSGPGSNMIRRLFSGATLKPPVSSFSFGAPSPVITPSPKNTVIAPAGAWTVAALTQGLRLGLPITITAPLGAWTYNAPVPKLFAGNPITITAPLGSWTYSAPVPTIVATESTFPTVEGTATSNATGTAPHTVSLPGTATAGDLLIIVFSKDIGKNSDAPTGWEELWADDSGSGESDAYYISAAGGETSVDVDGWNGSMDSDHVAYRISGWSAIESAVATGTGDNPDPPNLAPSWGSDNTLWIVVGTISDNQDYTAAPTNYGDLIQSTVFKALGSARRELEASSENPGTFSHPAAGESLQGATIAVQP